MFLAIILFYFFNVLREELSKACYQVGFLQHNFRQKLGVQTKVIIEGKNGELIYWDESGGVIKFEEHIQDPEKNLRVLVEILGIKYNFDILPVLYGRKDRRLSFRFLFSKKNDDTLLLVRKLNRMGWQPERLI